MNDRSVPLTSIIVYTLWGVSCVLLAGTWVAAILHRPMLAQALGITTCVLTGLAMTATIRAYVMRVCRLLRTVHGLENERPSASIRSLS